MFRKITIKNRRIKKRYQKRFSKVYINLQDIKTTWLKKSQLIKRSHGLHLYQSFRFVKPNLP